MTLSMSQRFVEYVSPIVCAGAKLLATHRKVSVVDAADMYRSPCVHYTMSFVRLLYLRLRGWLWLVPAELRPAASLVEPDRRNVMHVLRSAVFDGWPSLKGYYLPDMPEQIPEWKRRRGGPHAEEEEVSLVKSAVPTTL